MDEARGRPSRARTCIKARDLDSTPNMNYDTRALIPPDVQCFDISEIESEAGVGEESSIRDANGDEGSETECTLYATMNRTREGHSH